MTFKQIGERITLLRSKIAVHEMLILHLQTNYMPSDAGEAEMSVTRSDYGRVPVEHLETTIIDLVDDLDGMRVELDKLENTPFGEQPKPEVKAEVPDAARDQSEDKPAAEPKPVSAGNGRTGRSRTLPVRAVVREPAEGEGKPQP